MASAQKAAPAAKVEYVMPRPPAVVTWLNAPGGDAFYAIVTQYGRHAVSLVVFPPESRVGVPKEGVRYIDDPWNKTNGVSSDSGVWKFTPETRLLQIVANRLSPEDKRALNPTESLLVANLTK